MDVERIDDLETAKEVIRLQGAEIERLTRRINEHVAELAKLQGKPVPEQMALELSELQEQLSALQQRVYGDSSEKRPREKEPAEPEQKRGHGPRPQPKLREHVHVCELPEGERDCPGCGQQMTPMAGVTEDSDVITVVPRQFVLVHAMRQKYRCRNECTIVTAPGIERARDGGHYSLDFGAHVVAHKYVDHAPLERQVRAMKREGLDIDSQTLWDQVEAVAERLEPTYDAIREYIIGADVIGADETHWRLMGNKKSSKKWWAWGLTTHDACWYHIDESRSAKAAARVLEGFSGTVLCDGYKAYETLAKQPDRDIRLAHCWAHVRRKFVEAESNYPGPCREAIAMIGELFEIERELPKLGGLEGDEKQRVYDLRATTRTERSKPILARLQEWALEQRGLPKGGLRKAINYMLELWPGLTSFTEDPQVEIHNNGTERALRGMVIGRKNHYGSRSKRGTEVAAILYTLAESAKLCDVDPEAYIRAAAYYAIDNPGEVLLPSDFAG